MVEVTLPIFDRATSSSTFSTGDLEGSILGGLLRVDDDNFWFPGIRSRA